MLEENSLKKDFIFLNLRIDCSWFKFLLRYHFHSKKFKNFGLAKIGFWGHLMSHMWDDPVGSQPADFAPKHIFEQILSCVSVLYGSSVRNKLVDFWQERLIYDSYGGLNRWLFRSVSDAQDIMNYFLIEFLNDEYDLAEYNLEMETGLGSCWNVDLVWQQLSSTVLSLLFLLEAPPR